MSVDNVNAVLPGNT